MNKRIRSNHQRQLSLVAAAVAAALAQPTITWAQSADATLQGSAAANSVVTAVNTATGVTRHTTADSQGNYTLVGLPAGTYRVDAGPGTATTVTLTVASTARLDLAATGAAAAAAPSTALQEVTVSARRLVDVRTSEVGETVSQEQIATVPQITRNFLEFADTVPGVVFSVDHNGNTSLTGGAENASSVNVYIDGVGQKQYVKEGGVSGQFFSQGNPFPQLAIGEYRVITSNYAAEFDQVSSAAVIAETKSGTNAFHGEIFGDFTNQNLRAETPSEESAGMKTNSNNKEYGLAFGGPIIQDRMHFFVTYEGKKYNQPVTVVPGVSGVTGLNSLLPTGVASQFGPGDLSFKENLFFGKIDFEPTDSDRFELSSKVRREDQIGNIGVAQAQSASIDTKNNDTRVDLRWQHFADRWSNDLTFTYEDAFNSPSAQTLGNGAVYTYGPNNNQTIIDTGPANPLATQNKGQKGPGFQEQFTIPDIEFHGVHTLKAGVKWKQVKLTAQDAEDINPQFYYDVEPAAGTNSAGYNYPMGTNPQPYEAFFVAPVPGLNPTAEGTDNQLGLFLQDDWQATKKLMLNVGVRWDYEHNASYLNYVTPANVIAALNGPDPNATGGQTYAQTLALGGVNVNDYISTGHNRSPYKGEFQPRLGFSYDLFDDQKHVIFGGYGRAYDRDLFDYLQLEQTKSTLPTHTIFFPGGGGNSTIGSPNFAWNPNYLNGQSALQALVASTNAGSEVDMINNHIKAPYSDQFSIGIRNKVGDWNTSAAIARILSYDGFVFTLGNRYSNGAFWMNGSQPWCCGVPGFGALIIGNNGIQTRTTQVLLSAEKPYTRESGWGASIAYTFTDASQNRSITEHYSFDQETIHQYPFIRSNAAARHRLVMTGSVHAPWDLIAGAKLTLATPIPDDGIAFPGFNQPSGSSNVPVSATPPNFFGYRQLDLQATKNFELPRDFSVYVRVDVLNVFNWKNYNDYIENFYTNGVFNNPAVTYNQNGNIVGVPRELKLTVGGKF